MGWKAVKDHYRIEHFVRVEAGNICIGSLYIHDIIVIDPAGKIVKREAHGNRNLNRYLAEMDADPDKLAALIKSPDTFAAAIPVYTWENGQIIECLCEEPGWPNVTHDGRMMYENTFDTDRAKVVQWAVESTRSWIVAIEGRVIQAETDLIALESRLAQRRQHLASLEAEAA